ncbi:hypothetical protein BKI52_43990 [marine bacterium AO1-C]|nr:hypothetical protein BKI52_43990 [marine bacterium AO1-C]
MAFFKSQRLETRKEGLGKLTKINEDKDKVFIVHYSCESFKNENDRTPRIVSICLRNLGRKQIHTYSIHLKAQIFKKDIKNLSEEDYDICERGMLDDYYEFLKNKTKYKFVHWRMFNSSFGFEAIDNRYEILGGEPVKIDDENKFDLNDILQQVYTKNYVDKRGAAKGKMQIIAEINDLKKENFLSGKAEAQYFVDKRWMELHQSTEAKVKLFHDIIECLNDKSLKVTAKWYKIYGLSFNSISEILKNNAFLRVIWWIIVLFLGFFLRDFFNYIKKL